METNLYCDAKQVSIVFRFSKEKKENDGFCQFQEFATLSSFLEREIFEGTKVVLKVTEKECFYRQQHQRHLSKFFHFYFSFLELLSQFYDYVEIISLLFNFQGNRNDSAYQSSYFIVYHSIIILLFVCIKNVTYHATPSFSH